MLFWCYRINYLICDGLLGGGCEGVRVRGKRRGGSDFRARRHHWRYAEGAMKGCTFRFSDMIASVVLR